jgi:hypothetical protein
MLQWNPNHYHKHNNSERETATVYSLLNTWNRMNVSSAYIHSFPYIYFASSTLFPSCLVVGARDLRPLWSPPVSLNVVHVLVFFRNFLFFIFLIFMCFLFLLLFCIIKIKCFFFIFIYIFIWMQVWSLEKEDTPHSFSSRVFHQYI